MCLLLFQLLVFLPLGEAGEHLQGSQYHSVLSQRPLERHHRELPVGNHGEADDKPDLFVALPHLMGASPSGESQRQREKMLSRFGRFWKKPDREPHLARELDDEQVPPGTQAHTQPMNAIKMEKSPLQEEAKKFWHHFMFRKSPASQGIILPIKSHEVHWETCRTVPFSQVRVLGGGLSRWRAGTGGGQEKETVEHPQILSLVWGLHKGMIISHIFFFLVFYYFLAFLECCMVVLSAINNFDNRELCSIYLS